MGVGVGGWGGVGGVGSETEKYINILPLKR